MAKVSADEAEEQVKPLAAAGLRCPREGAQGACLDVQRSLDARDMFSNAALWSFVGAGVLGAATGIYGLAARKPATTGLQVAPAVGIGSGAVIVRGEF